jgi:polyisoprenoid-binding protein YceI
MATHTWQIDPAHTDAAFAVKHLMISTVRGHFGKVSGTVTVDENDPKSAKVDVHIETGSIDTRQPGRDEHLRSADFFDVANHPEIHFVSKRVEGDPKGEFKLIGDLTIRGTTREITLEVTNEGIGDDPWGNLRAGFNATTKIRRGEFGLTWNQALETGGVVVGDEVKITIDAEVTRAKDAAKAA